MSRGKFRCGIRALRLVTIEYKDACPFVLEQCGDATPDSLGASTDQGHSSRKPSQTTRFIHNRFALKFTAFCIFFLLLFNEHQLRTIGHTQRHIQSPGHQIRAGYGSFRTGIMKLQEVMP